MLTSGAIRIRGLFLLIIVFLVSLFLEWDIVTAQTGKPFITNYELSDYRGDYIVSPQNWGFAQDSRGIIYIVNSSGILEYDGTRWRKLKLPKEESSAILIDNSGKIYIGLNDDFGFLSLDSIGSLYFNSLVPHIPEQINDIGDIRYIHNTNGQIFFMSRNKLFRFHNNKISILEPDSMFLRSYLVNDRYYVLSIPSGLMQISDSSLIPVNNNHLFKDLLIRFMLPFKNEKDGEEDQILIGTKYKGFFIWNGESLQKFKTDIDYRLGSINPFRGLLLPNGNYAIGTLGQGIFIIDSRGKLINEINENAGLQSLTIISMFLDKQQNLWAGLDDGISKIEISSPITFFDDESGIEDRIISISEIDGNLYFAGTNNVYFLNENVNRTELKLMDNLGFSQCWQFLNYRSKHLLATTTGIFQINFNSAELYIPLRGASTMYPSRMDSNRIFVGGNYGLFSIYYDGSDWVNEGFVINGEEIRYIAETDEGILWASYYDVYRIDYSNGFVEDPHVEFFSDSNGLPEKSLMVAVYYMHNKLHFCTTYGMYSFDEESTHFLPDSSFDGIFIGDGYEPIPMVEDEDGNIWVQSDGKFGMIKTDSTGKYHWDSTVSMRIPEIQIWSLYPDKNGIVWAGASKHIFRFDPKIQRNYTMPLPLIRKVTVKEDSTIFWGTYNEKNENGSYNITFSQSEHLKPTLFYADNSITFEFSATYYENESANQFSYFLDGFDKNWSQWSTETKKSYTNLPPGTHIFRVKGKNIYDRKSLEASYQFTILPPWYMTGWAYSGYGMLFIAFIFGWDSIRLMRMRAAKNLLRQKVRERTQALEGKNIELIDKNEQLRIAKEKAEQSEQFKELFLANMSHEIRTPMNAILGFTQLLLKRQDLNEEQVEYLSTIKISSDNLLVIINDILDLSKIEAGKLTIEHTDFSLRDIIKVLHSMLNPKAEEKNIELKVEVDEICNV